MTPEELAILTGRQPCTAPLAPNLCCAWLRPGGTFFATGPSPEAAVDALFDKLTDPERA